MPNANRLFCEYCVQDYDHNEITPSYRHDPTDTSEEALEEFSKGKQQYRCPDCKNKLVNLKS